MSVGFGFLIASVAAILMITWPTTGHAQTIAIRDFEHIAKNICDLDPASGKQVLDQKALLDWLYSVKPVSDAARDDNNDGGVSWAEKVNAIANPQFSFDKKKKFISENDDGNIRAIRNALVVFTSRYDGKIFEFPTASRDSNGALRISLGDFLSNDPRLIRIGCSLPRDQDTTVVGNGSATGSGEANTPAGEEEDQHKVNIKDSSGPEFRAVLLRGTEKDLTNPSLMDAAAAELSMQKDLKDKEKSYQMTGVVGVDLGLETANKVTRFIPYIKVDRSFTSGNDTDTEDINNLGIGLLGTTFLDLASLGSHQFILSPLFTTDSEAKTHIGSLKFRWIPAFTIGDQVITGFYRGGHTVLWKLAVDGIANGGHVFDDGGNESLDDDKSFLYAGGEIGLKLLGHPDNSFLAPLSWRTFYRYLDGLNGKLSHVKRFESNLGDLAPVP